MTGGGPRRPGPVRELLLASRPFSWVNTALPFAAAAFGGAGHIDALTLVGIVYFLVPYNLLLYGVNDLYDHASDVRNPRKGSIEGGLVPSASGRRLWLAVAATNAPPLMLIAWLGGPVVAGAFLVTALVAWLYSAPPLRTKERPFLDSVTSAAHFVLPAACGFLAAGVPAAAIPWPLLAAFLAWGVASHALGAIQDIRYDREGGIRSIATALGARRTALVSLAGYLAAVALVATQGPAGWVAAAAMATYLLLPLTVLARVDEAAARQAWRGFLGLNLLVGFVLTQLLLRLWGVTAFSVTELLVALGVGSAAVVLLVSVSSGLLVPRVRPAAQVSAGEVVAGPARLTVVVPCRDEADRLPGALAGLRHQAGVAFRVLVVDDGSQDGTPAVARDWLAARGAPAGALLTAPPVPAGWTGKSWAAWMGARAATTELVLFLDADTILRPGALAALVASSDGARADLLSGVTRYAMASAAERLLMPGFPLLLFGFLPLGLLARTGGRPAWLAFAYGPLVLVRRDAYLALDGHRAIADSARDDVDLARAFVRSRRRVAIVNAADLAATRHYPDARSIASAWRRILVAYTDASLAVGLATIVGVFLAWGLPVLLPVAGAAAGDPRLLAGGLLALGSMMAARLLMDATQRMPLSGILWHPLTVGATLVFQIVALLAGVLGSPAAWRGRPLPAQEARRAVAAEASAPASATNGWP